MDLEVSLMERIEAEAPVEETVTLSFDDLTLGAEAPAVVALDLEAT